MLNVLPRARRPLGVIGGLVSLGLLMLTGPALADDPLRAAVDDPGRSATFVARDGYRNPYETLRFFGVQPHHTVVEISPGGGWYTEILAPYLRESGQLYAAHFDPDSAVTYYQRSRKNFLDKLAGDPTRYDRVTVTAFAPPDLTDIAPAASADRVLTFRNVHNWYMRGKGEDTLNAAFAAFFRALKPGGVLGVVEHRLPADRPLADQDDSGYMREDVVIAAARAAGFQLEAQSNINANPLDTADHPAGVWSLPPSLRGGEDTAGHYLTIGESDRMTLRFVKPEN